MKKYEIEINGEFYEVSVRELAADAEMNSGQTEEQPTPTPDNPRPASRSAGSTDISAPMSGTILKVYAKPGQNVRQGDTLLVLEAMKMENEIVAPQDGVVQDVHVQENERVASNQLLITL